MQFLFYLSEGNSRVIITNRTNKIAILIKTIILNRKASPNSIRPNHFAGKYDYEFSKELTLSKSVFRYTRDISRKNSLPTSDRLEETQASVTDSRPSKNLFYGLNIDTDVKQTDEEYNSNNRTRTKRQSLGRSSLCAVNTQYIMPQAALNNRGICICGGDLWIPRIFKRKHFFLLHRKLDVRDQSR